MSSLAELFPFLHAPNPDARQLALTNLVGHTPKSSPNRLIFIPRSSGVSKGGGLGGRAKQTEAAKNADLEDKARVEVLHDLKNLCRDTAMIAHDAFSALINLSDTLMVARHLVDEPFLVFLVSYTANPTSPLSPLSAMLLSNLTSHPTLTPLIPSLLVPIILFPPSSLPPPPEASSTPQPPVPNYYYPASRSSSTPVHPSYRPEMETTPDTLHQMEAVRALVQAFEDGAAEGVEEGAKGAKRKGGVHFLGSVFANISMLPQTRKTLLIPYASFPNPSSTAPGPDDEPLLSKLMVFTEHKDVIRRGGVLGCVKNAAMDRASHPFLLAAEDERVTLPSDATRKVRGVDVLPYLLLPLMGPEELELEETEALPASLQFLGEDKTRERDPVLRAMGVEVLLLLATSFTGREMLRNRGTYIVIRLAHAAEQDDKINELMIRLVGLLQREEGQESSRDVLEAKEFGQEVVALPGVEEEVEEDDSDMEIEVI